MNKFKFNLKSDYFSLIDVLRQLSIQLRIKTKRQLAHKLFLVGIFSFCILIIHSNPALAKTKIAIVELQWEQVEGAFKYELEIQSLTGKKLKVFNSKTGKFLINMPVGKYQVRARVADRRNVFSDWSDKSDFTVPVDAPILQNSEVTTVNPKPGTLTAKVDVKWTPSPQADFYKLQIMNEKNEVALEYETTQSHYTLNLPPGEHSYRVIAVNKQTNIESIPPVNNNKVVVSTSKLPPPIYEEVTDEKLVKENFIKWKELTVGACSGDLEYMPHMGTQWKAVKNYAGLNESSLQVGNKLRPGKYRLKLWAEAQGFQKSDVVYSREFVVKPTEADLPVVPY